MSIDNPDTGILCPRCHSRATQVRDTRPAGNWQRRRRFCTNCGLRFTTYEMLETAIEDQQIERLAQVSHRVLLQMMVAVSDEIKRRLAATDDDKAFSINLRHGSEPHDDEA